MTKLNTQSTVPVKTRTDWQYCEKILPEVSRTFALNIGALKGDTHKATLLGYLFFRIADTFEDNKFQNETQKIKALLHFADIFRGNKNLNERLKLYKPLKLQWEDNSPEKDLLQNGDRAIRCYFDLPTIYREIIDRHITLTSEGMAKFQKRKRDSSTEFFQLQDINDLEEYCYYVAGVVGEMLTQIFSQQPDITTIKSQLEDHQIQFGLALQMTNIMKDYQKDIGRGWCYIPASITEICGITLDKVKSLSVGQKRRILSELTPIILSYFDSTLKYIKIIPVTQRAIRMFCIIPFVLAYNTLYHLVRMKGEKLSRGQVTALLTKCNSFAESNELLEKDYLKIHRKLI